MQAPCATMNLQTCNLHQIHLLLDLPHHILLPQFSLSGPQQQPGLAKKDGSSHRGLKDTLVLADNMV